MNNQVRVGLFSFFSGAGFLDLGFEKTSGYEVLFVNEYHKPFLEIYKSSRQSLKHSRPQMGYNDDDICSFLKGKKANFLNENTQDAKRVYDFVGYIGGPPCPDFSVGGKNKGSTGENGKLSRVYFDLIINNQPDFFLFENVKGLYRTKKHREFFEEMKLNLITGGYKLTEKVINAIEFGAPQDRERIILIGFREEKLQEVGAELGETPFLNDFDWNSRIKYSAEEIIKKPWPTQDAFKENESLMAPPGIIKKLTVEHWFRKNDVDNHPNAQHYFQPRAGLPKFQIIDEGDDLKKSYKRLHRWRYSPTAAYGNNEVHLHPYKARRLSAAEALALQSLPKEFVIPPDMTLSNMFKTIGNGVPFLAAKGLAGTIFDYIKKINQPQPIYEKTISE
ncbi:DNA cytosine methyltransferase [Antarcticibacterium sp. 1MA-6-2]|uniref:DNA cytosine methyltransferase n=1 Tax=Antarcticibacterium sp. 1MA-6-2 TaxID=2908210 RepID=UPI001F40BB7E|nr:DNA cytosine methyltransferase [Antarcticibacterium sp. 1MA-6-2]UJH90930.1 DNA cytosine methyltransferase [Antarcticibacterium sp. 1MA-6-2]